jgi:hypothetical protein
MRYRVTGYDRSGSNLFSRVVDAISPDHAKIDDTRPGQKDHAEGASGDAEGLGGARSTRRSRRAGSDLAIF